MNTPTLSQLADIGAKAAQVCLLDEGDDTSKIVVRADHSCYTADAQAREAFAKAVLDAVGYKFPVDPEREAFDAWVKEATCLEGENRLFEAWKAGRAARDKELEIQDARSEQEHAAEIADDGPPWIEWKGGKCPIPDTVKRWVYRTQDGFECEQPATPSMYDVGWEHVDGRPENRITAYRVLDWGTAKQPATFEAHGHTWFKHTPGDPMPVAEDTKVDVIMREEKAGAHFRSQPLPARLHRWNTAEEEELNTDGTDVVGWRYADS